MEIGAQFYTIRDFCTNTEDFGESLKKVADIGYKYIQVSGTCQYEGDWLKSQLDKNGLKCVLTHSPADQLTNDTQQLAEKHDIFGCDYVGLGFYPFFEECNTTEKFLQQYKPVAQTLKANNKYFMYHNHGFDLAKEGDKVRLEILAENMSPDEMGFILDTYWVQNAEGDPAYWIEKLKNRVPCIHIKDHTFDGKMAVIGEGNINFERVFQKAEAAGTKYMLVEQDDCYGQDPFDCLKRSYEYLKSCGF